MIEGKNLHFSYTKDEPIFDSLSFSVDKGEYIAVIGSNGSGKSTLAKLMNALLLPSEGTLLVNGFDTKNEETLWDVRKSAGMIFQNPGNQIVGSSVEEDVAFGPENLGVPSDIMRETVDTALEKVNMEAYKEHPPHLLSGGQMQRVSIAGVLAMEPECIIFDEATSMLDPMGRSEVLDIINVLREEGITIITITHFMEEVVDCDKVAVIDGGKIAVYDTPREIFKQAKQLESWGLSLPPMTKLAKDLEALGKVGESSILNIEDFVSLMKESKETS